MKLLKQNHTGISTVLAFALIPLSGFATDIYLPSFPTMAAFFGTSQSDIQLSLVAFIISAGIAQLFVGGLLDSFGRYRLTLVSLAVFTASNIAIALSHSIGIVLAMRVVQGISVALIVVGKRAFFVDVHSGERLRHYTSLFSIIWATAPITAPFIGGFLHHYFGWESNFYFLGAATFIILLLELAYGGETIKAYHPFRFKPMLDAYKSKLATADFTVSLVILGFTYAMVMVYNMTSPFIIEEFFHRSPVVTGNTSLLSGLALLTGGLLGKATMRHPLRAKMSIAGTLLLVLSLFMAASMHFFPNLYAMIAFVILLHITSGFTYNTFYTYALTRFTTHAGTVSGITGGSTFIITSLLSYALVTVLQVKSPLVLSFGYVVIVTVTAAAFAAFLLVRRNVYARHPPAIPVPERA